MKRDRFLKLIGLGAAAMAVPSTAKAFFDYVPPKPAAVIPLTQVPIVNPEAFKETYVALHTSDPGSMPVECDYKGYSRVQLRRGEWEFNANGITNRSQILFPQCAGKSNLVKGFSIVNNHGVLYEGPIDQALVVSEFISPCFSAGSIQITLD